MIVALEAEPSPLMRAFLADRSGPETQVLRPWRLPPVMKHLAPQRLRRFAAQRCLRQGQALLGFTAAEIAVKAWAGTRSDRILHNLFQLRRLLGLWAARQPCVARASTLVAPGNAARALFAAAPAARKILLLDMPGLRCMHEDLDRAAARHPGCVYLNRYRAPDWTVVDQEVEWQLADEIHVRGRFARRLLLEHGVPARKIVLLEARKEPVPRDHRSPGAELRVVLAGLASARHGTNELLQALESRPWLRVHARAGEGCEPRALLEHSQVERSSSESLSRVDAVLVPSFVETYLPELAIAAASRIPIIASLRGAGAVPRDQLFAELPAHIGPALGVALDALYAAVLVDPQAPVRGGRLLPGPVGSCLDSGPIRGRRAGVPVVPCPD